MSASRPATPSRRCVLWWPATAALLGFVLLAGGLVRMPWQPLRAVDQHAAARLHGWAADQPVVEGAMQVVTELGGGEARTVLLGALTIFLLVRRQVRAAVFVAVSGLVGAALSEVTKAVVGRERPPTASGTDVSGLAYPSGHAMGSAVAAMVVLIVLLPRATSAWRWGAVTLGAAFVVAVGLSRVVLGVHWPSDVIGGWLLALAWVLTTTAVLRPTRERPARPSSHRSG